MKKKWVIIAALSILVIGGGGYWAYQHFKAKPQTTSVITAKAKKGDVKKQITATGTVKYPEVIPLAFKQAGTVKEIYVKAGDSVKAGQALAQLDTTTLQQDVAQSVANLKEAEVNWQQQYVQAQAAVVKAEQTLQTAEQNADPAYLANQVYLAEQNVLLASNNLAKAQQSGNSSSIQQAQTALAQAQANLIAAQNAQNGGAAQAVETAKADLAAARAKLEQLAAKTSLAQAQTALAKAQDNLANATLTAPADGVIIDVPVKKAQTVGSSTTIMNLATGGNLLQVDAAVSQAEVTDIKTGQKVDITLDSAPDNHISGTVSQVALQGTTTQNVTTFTVTIQVDQPTEFLRAGMNVNVAITVAEAKNVLTVPSQAIRTFGNRKGVLVPQPADASSPNLSTSDGSNRRAQEGSSSSQDANSNQSQAGNSGNIPNPNRSQNSSSGNRQLQSGSAGLLPNTRFIPVETGLDDGTNVEIKSGLTEGQEVVIGTRSTTTSNSSNNSRTGNTFPGGSIPGMGQFTRPANAR